MIACWKRVIFFVGVVCLVRVTCEDDPEDVENDEVVREGKTYMLESWHAMHTIPEGASGWIPRDPNTSQRGVVYVKRRRLRKRKRRPPLTDILNETSSESYESFVNQEQNRRKLDTSSEEPWTEMQEESNKPTIRRKVTPAYESSEDINPLRASIQVAPIEVITKRPNLKEILKQNGDLSLSEILQQKNISLHELLTGDQEAIKALTEATTQRVEPTTQEGKFKRIPPSIGLRKNDNRRYESSENEAITSKEIHAAQRKRLSLLQTSKYNHFPQVTRYELITEPTTEKRLFVPVTAKDNEQEQESTEPVISIEEVEVELLTTPVPKLKLPITNFKFRTGISTTTSEQPQKIVDVKPIEISIQEIIGIPVKTTEKIPDEPLHMNIDLEPIMEETTTTTTTQKPATISPRIEARNEILEVLKDPKGRLGLARILEARNMSIEELIDLRERGSSQLHLADIFHNNTREPEPLEAIHEGSISAEVINTIARQPKGLTVDSSEIMVPDATFAPDSDKIKPINELFPWQHLSMNDPNDVDIVTDENLRVLDEVDQRLYAASSNEYANNVEETSQTIINVSSSSLKSTLFASCTIVFLSIIIFVTILLIFKWAQRRKKKSTFGDNMKPALIHATRRNIKTIFADTLKRTKVNYYRRHLQSMSDDSWDRESRQQNAF